MKKPPSTTTSIYEATLAKLRKLAASKGWPMVLALKVAVDEMAEKETARRKSAAGGES